MSADGDWNAVIFCNLDVSFELRCVLPPYVFIWFNVVKTFITSKSRSQSEFENPHEICLKILIFKEFRFEDKNELKIEFLKNQVPVSICL